MADVRPVWSLVALILIILIVGIAGRCTYQEEPLNGLTQAQKAEIISRMGVNK